MINFFNYVTAKNNNKGKDYIKYQLLVIIFFAIAYWTSDQLYSYAPEFFKKLGLGEIKKPSSVYSYIYLSLITQTTVGFGGILPDGGHFIQTQSVVLRYLVITQLLSIILISGWVLV